MPATTYTVLVTVAHSGTLTPPSSGMLEAMIERGLEEDVRDMAGVEAASASAIVGDYMGVCKLGGDANEANVLMARARKLHTALRA